VFPDSQQVAGSVHYHICVRQILPKRILLMQNASVSSLLSSFYIRAILWRGKKDKQLMKKICLLACSFLLLCNFASARHIKGGWVQYTYLRPGSAEFTSMYSITVYVFRDCTQTGPMPTSLGIYDAVTYAPIQLIAGTATAYTLQGSPTKTTFDPCMNNKPTICYQIYTYNANVTLPDNTNGYLIAAQDANRITGIINVNNSVSTGISFVGNIPGIINNVDYHINASPSFVFKDTAIICYGSKFSYQFTATDQDNDSLTYSFGNGINGTQTLTAPPYSPLSYTTGFTGRTPLGGSVSIDSTTGLISGTAPVSTGEYVIAVYVHEWRDGELINSTRKELQITVGNCSLSAASLKPAYINCDTYDFAFQNESISSNITSYLWDFGVAGSSDTSSKPAPVYTYSDTGTYRIKLIVSNTLGCTDSTFSTVKVYPGFTPSFLVAGSCFQSPFQFTDNSFIKYGTASWLWNFGDLSTTDDTSILKNPFYQYAAAGSATVIMTVNSSKGCSGSYTKLLSISQRPYINLGFTDTLICSIDSVPLKAQTNGAYHWSPNYNISDTAIGNPIVYPKDTTVYTLTVKEQGCIDSAKVKINVLKFISVKLGLDSGICKTDSIILRPVSHALNYQWRESTNVNSMNSHVVKYPVVAPAVTTTYYVTANLGYCQDSTKIKINVSPYPQIFAGNDATICFGNRVQLNAIITAHSFVWTASNSLLNTHTLTPVAGPTKTTAYVLTVKDTAYCPRQVSDTVLVKVIQPMHVNAGKDTAITLGQALPLFATGADTSYQYTYQWTPVSFLDNSFIHNPVVTITANNIDSIWYNVKVTSPDGCSASDDILIHVYRNGPQIFVPTAFTPNGDGRNDLLRPILVGIAQFDFFNVYNRWGQPVFSTKQRNSGWDGYYNGAVQQAGTYVYTTQGKDITGKTVYRKGTVVLIR
jgi:gliding motility-associated-like protein